MNMMDKSQQELSFCYQNAPLLEVIAEIRWKLQSLQAIPDAAIDPYFEDFEIEFHRQIQAEGYTYREEIIPEDIPREFTGGQPMYRYRKAANSWPLFQVGQGIFTVNMVPEPEYSGWSQFYPIVEKEIKVLFETYPLAQKYLKIDHTELRYINGFTSKHGYTKTTYAQFVEQMLNMKSSIDPSIVGAFADTLDNLYHVNQTVFDLNDLLGAKGIIKVAPGRRATNHSSEEAVLLELIVRSKGPDLFSNAGSIISWMGEAHRIIRNLFQSLTSESLKHYIGPKNDIKG